ncbi:hypothetical protein SLAV_22400 [Streptomyces lavendulae subsp. lavendulae]|uniref:Uncharacterized protein n=1 Tax=Streptomyces lavendulae subsp. lavendulae TaxID=58340 RepID=A0A2K8PKY5_STRLA|nr:hypothetical protein SLAV_22400 [Streptomyces lavendulae subsp. lavendulae]QUQ56123.1 hypothetical protein SLLC_20510 [Streptomyces lavendulae subsp. lavendulae]
MLSAVDHVQLAAPPGSEDPVGNRLEFLEPDPAHT